MISRHISTLTIFCALSVTINVNAAKLNVPDDFPNSFHMDLLSGYVNVDFESGAAAPGLVQVNPTGGVSQILFDATAFDGVGIGEGTSALTLTSTTTTIASFESFGTTGSFYIDGNGSGTLRDNGDGSGHWSMDIPLFAEWGGTIFNFNTLILSTDSSYNYFTNQNDIFGNFVGQTQQTVNGVAMDYETGDAFLVGQSTINEAGHPFDGLRITLGLHGNDPVLVTPIPAAGWLFCSGLIALFGFARARKAR